MMKGAIVGFGFISSQGHLPAYLARARAQGDVEIVAIADVCQDRRDKAAEALPGVRTYPDHRSLLESEAGNLDFIDISTPPVWHAEIAHAALDSGLHVLCEKPLTTQANEALELMEHALKARRVLFPVHNYKHAPVIRELRSILASGEIGQVHSVKLTTFRNTHARGIPEWNPDWRRDPTIGGGGIAMDHGSHSLYLIFEWLRGYPLSVSAKTFNANAARFPTEDAFTATLAFPTGLAELSLSWNSSMRKVIYALEGDRGGIRVEDDQIQVNVPEAGGWKIREFSAASHWMDASHVGWFGALFDEFLGAIARNDFVGRETIDAYHCVRTIAAGYRSARMGCLEQPLQSSVARSFTAQSGEVA